MTNTNLTAAQAAKLIRRLERAWHAAIRREENASSMSAAWRLAGYSDIARRRLLHARAGRPIPPPVIPRTARNMAKGAFAALAALGRAIALALKSEAGLRLARTFTRLGRVELRKNAMPALSAFAAKSGRTMTYVGWAA